MKCEICTNDFNSKKRTKIVCNHCGKECCRVCVERYMLDDTREIHCMFCKKVWDYVFIYNNMSQMSLKKIRDKQAKQLLESEKNLLPETQKYVEYDRYICRLEKQIEDNLIKTNRLSALMIGIEKELSLKCCPNEDCKAMYVFHKDKICYKCKYSICTICRSSIKDRDHKCDEQRIKIYKEYQQYVKERISLFHNTEELKNKVIKWRNNYVTEEDLKEYDNKIVCICVKDECKGYIMTKTGYQCNMCDTRICPQCYVKVKDGIEHICNRDDIRSVKVIKQTTKPCPSCGTLIQKIDGCNQMWCTSCNTAFGWVTGKIEMGPVHNPHYFEWYNRIGERVNNNEDNVCLDCEGVPEQRYFMTHVSLVCKRRDMHTHNILITFFRLLLHINDLVQEEEEETNVIKKNLDLRISWIHNKIDDKKWSSLLYQRYKKGKVREIRNEVFRMFTTASSDICHRILSCTDFITMTGFNEEWYNLINYTNKCFMDLNRIFNLCMPNITIEDDYNFVVKMKHKY